MNNKSDLRKLLLIASGFVLLSIILIICTLPGIISDTSPGSNPKAASIGALIAIVLRALVLFGFYSLLRSYKRRHKMDRGLGIGLAILMLILGFAIIDGAFAFLDELKIVSILFFITAIFDLLAATISFVVAIKYRRPKE